MKKTYRWKYSIRQVVSISIAALLFVNIAMSLSFLKYSITLSTETKKELFKYRAEVMLIQTENNLDEVLSLTQKLGRDTEIQKFFENSFHLESEKTITLCNEMKNADSNIENIIMVNNNKAVYNCYGFDDYMTDLLEKIYSFENFGVVHDTLPHYIVADKVYNREYTEELGKIVIVLKSDMFLQSIYDARLNKNNKVVIAYDDVNILPILNFGYIDNFPNNWLYNYSLLKDMNLDEIEIGEKNWGIIKTTAKKNNLIFYLIIPPDNLKLDIPINLWQYLIVWVLATVFIFCLLINLFKSMTVSKIKINKILEEISLGHFEEDKDELPISELQNVAENIYFMADRIIALRKKNSVAEKQLIEKENVNRQTMLEALKNQINPHFIYNTLSCIKSISNEYGDDRISKMCTSIIKILRYSIQDSLTAYISEEIDSIKSYLYIQSCRFEDKFTYHITVDDSIMNCRILRFSLQPILENSITHGISPKNSYGKIVISGSQKDDFIIFTISDTGVGMTEEETGRLQERLDSCFGSENVNKSNYEYQHGIGLKNINKRVKLFYGTNYGLSVKSIKNVGTFVTLTLPKV